MNRLTKTESAIFKLWILCFQRIFRLFKTFHIVIIGWILGILNTYIEETVIRVPGESSGVSCRLVLFRAN